MSTNSTPLSKKEEKKEEEEEATEMAKHKKSPRQNHKKREQSKYDSMKVYPTSNISSRERLQKKILESKENASVVIRWDEILC